jgi:pimeloyl-ACP methyl ester carboxylesterase
MRTLLRILLSILLLILLVGLIAALLGPFVVSPRPAPGVTDATLVAAPESRFIALPNTDTESQQFHYMARLEARPPGPAFMLLHGFTFNLFTWNQLFDVFAQYGPVVAYDQLPYGLSAKPVPDPASGPDLYSKAAALEQVVRACRCARTGAAHPGWQLLGRHPRAGGSVGPTRSGRRAHSHCALGVLKAADLAELARRTTADATSLARPGTLLGARQSVARLLLRRPDCDRRGTARADRSPSTHGRMGSGLGCLAAALPHRPGDHR